MLKTQKKLSRQLLVLSNLIYYYKSYQSLVSWSNMINWCWSNYLIWYDQLILAYLSWSTDLISYFLLLFLKMFNCFYFLPVNEIIFFMNKKRLIFVSRHSPSIYAYISLLFLLVVGGSTLVTYFQSVMN